MDTFCKRCGARALALASSEDLRYEFGIEGDILEDVTRVISSHGSNPFLVKYSSGLEMTPLTVDVRGIAYENRYLIASNAKNGQRIDLLRDYDNPVDHNAIKVLLKGQALGFIPRQIAQLLAPDMD